MIRSSNCGLLVLVPNLLIIIKTFKLMPGCALRPLPVRHRVVVPALAMRMGNTADRGGRADRVSRLVGVTLTVAPGRGGLGAALAAQHYTLSAVLPAVGSTKFSLHSTPTIPSPVSTIADISGFTLT